jgi:hypothetical protein
MQEKLTHFLKSRKMQERKNLNFVNQLGLFNIFNSGKLEIDVAHSKNKS